MDTDADLKGVVVEMAEHIAENLPASEQFGFHHVIKMVRDGTVGANFLSQMLKEMKKNSATEWLKGGQHPQGSTGTGSWSSSPTPSEAYGPCWSKGDVGQPWQSEFSWADVSEGKGKQSFQPDFSQGKGKQYPPQEQCFSAGMSMRTGGRGKGFKGEEKGKKGEGRYYDERRIFANSGEEAQHNLNSWVLQHKDFVFHPRHLNNDHINLWKGTGEHKFNLLKNIHRHVKERPACLEEILEDMVRTSHWPVDRLNRMEKQRQEQHKGFADGRSSVSRFTTRAYFANNAVAVCRCVLQRVMLIYVRYDVAVCGSESLLRPPSVECGK